MFDDRIDALIVDAARKAKVSKSKLATLALDVYAVARSNNVRPDMAAIRGRIMSQRGDFTSAQVADSLGVTVQTVNNHVYALERNGKIKFTGDYFRSGHTGKPAKFYRVI